MAASSKRLRIEEESPYRVWLRLCDPFIRTDGNLICPIIKAETSIRVLYTLKKKTLDDILHNVCKETGMKTQEMTLKSSSDRDLQGNLFIQCASSDIIDIIKINNFKEKLTLYLSKYTTVKNIAVDQVNSTEEIIPQPMISEPDFEMHKLELCYKELSQRQSNSDETDAESFIRDSIKNTLDELKNKHTKIAILSQNGKGKSFLLNLLFLLTIDNEEEYQNNNKKLKLPKDITGDPTIEELGETINELPDVVKNFLKKYKNTNEKFKKLMESICVELKPADSHAIEQSKNMLSSLPNYFKEGRNIDDEPYILPQKDLEHSLESTTKCIIHLRYGTVYQMKMDYFSSEDLKQQLFELVSMRRNYAAKRNNQIGFIKDKEYKCLETRFAILTDSNIADINEEALQRFTNYTDIVLSEEVEKFAGRTELYIGSGKNSTEDRLAVKAILKGLVSPQHSDGEEGKWKYRVAAVKEFVVYLPSKILHGGKEILEMPGTDDSDALALHFIDKGLNKVDAVCVVSDFTFKIAEKEVKDILNNSNFMKKWKKRPELASLMFLTYPEKNRRYQFKNGDIAKIEKLEELEAKKREIELEHLCNLTEMSQTDAVEAAVFTSYILPILHTSIHAQEGTPHEVIQDHACFLKFTGIQKLITHLDTFISSSRKMDFIKVQQTLKTMTTKGLKTPGDADIIFQIYQKRELKAVRENELFRQYENLLTKLFKNLKTVYISELDGQVAETLAEKTTEALKLWDLNDKNMTSVSVFNPFFVGNHGKSKAKIARIFLNNTECLNSKIFAFLSKEIDTLLNTFEKEVIDLFAEELNTLLEISTQKKTDARDFVEQSIQGVLSEARQWYIGRTQKPINEDAVGKHLKKSKNVVLKKYILEPAYKHSDLNLAKQLARRNIAYAVMAMKEELKTALFELHYTRWTSFCKHSKKNSIPKAWPVLLSKLKQLSRSTNIHPVPDELLPLSELIAAKMPK